MEEAKWREWAARSSSSRARATRQPLADSPILVVQVPPVTVASPAGESPAMDAQEVPTANVEQPPGGVEPVVVATQMNLQPVEIASLVPRWMDEERAEEVAPAVHVEDVAQPVVPSPLRVKVEASEAREIILVGDPL